MTRIRWGVVIALAVGVLAAEWSMAVKWDDAIVGVALLVYQVPLVLALLVGVGLGRSPGLQPAAPDDGAPRPKRTVTLVVVIVMLVLVAACVAFAVTDRSAPGIDRVRGGGCPGSPLTPTDYDCTPGTAGVYLTGLAALVLGGWAMRALDLRRVRLPWAAVTLAGMTGVALLVAAVAAVPGAYPAYDSPGAPIQSSAFQDWAFARVLGELHSAGTLLVLAVALLAPLAWSRWDRGVRLPVPAVLVGVLNVAVAGLVVMTAIWVPMLAYFMSGP